MGLENPEDYTGHALRRTAATIMADKGASGQTLRHKLNQRSEKAVNEYLSSSKAVQRNNAMLLSGFEEKNENETLKEPAQVIEEETARNSIASLNIPSTSTASGEKGPVANPFQDLQAIASLIRPSSSSTSSDEKGHAANSIKDLQEAFFSNSGVLFGCNVNFNVGK